MTGVTLRSSDPDRGATELILGALAGSALLPFIQAVATKAGEDVYQLVRAALSRRARRNAEAELREAGTVTVAGPDSRVVLQLPERITPAMASGLANVRLPRHRAGWVRVAWDHAQGRWVVEDVPEPPPTTISLEGAPEA